MRSLVIIIGIVVIVATCSLGTGTTPPAAGSAEDVEARTVADAGAAPSASAPADGVEDGAATNPPTAATRASVDIANFAFSPASVTTGVGGTVTWTNRDGDRHSIVIAGDESPRLGSGATYSRTFDAAGRFAYVCGIHSSMSGTVTVLGEAGSAPPPNEASAGGQEDAARDVSDEDADEDGGGHHSGRGGDDDRSDDHSGHGRGGDDRSGPGGGGSGPG
ncbi:MAG TPA: plastocyanin/azurin family copper-binding protein [Candidatus Limnocylindrales bacterium]|nr:plastocyanin/azurin family copper-binding protein [Candidatus Limnocylindrales bacterium]